MFFKNFESWITFFFLISIFFILINGNRLSHVFHEFPIPNSRIFGPIIFLVTYKKQINQIGLDDFWKAWVENIHQTHTKKSINMLVRLKVSKFQKQIFLVSFATKTNKIIFFLISAPASKMAQIKKMKALL